MSSTLPALALQPPNSARLRRFDSHSARALTSPSIISPEHLRRTLSRTRKTYVPFSVESGGATGQVRQLQREDSAARGTRDEMVTWTTTEPHGGTIWDSTVDDEAASRLSEMKALLAAHDQRKYGTRITLPADLLAQLRTSLAAQGEFSREPHPTALLTLEELVVQHHLHAGVGYGGGHDVELYDLLVDEMSRLGLLIPPVLELLRTVPLTSLDLSRSARAGAAAALNAHDARNGRDLATSSSTFATSTLDISDSGSINVSALLSPLSAPNSYLTLNQLSLATLPLTPSDLATLSTSTTLFNNNNNSNTLKSLNLNATGMTLSHAVAIALPCAHLQHLRLADNPNLDDEALRVLFSCTVAVAVAPFGAGEEGPDEGAHVGLQTLDLRGTAVSARGVRRVCVLFGSRWRRVNVGGGDEEGGSLRALSPPEEIVGWLTELQTSLAAAAAETTKGSASLPLPPPAKKKKWKSQQQKDKEEEARLQSLDDDMCLSIMGTVALRNEAEAWPPSQR